MNDEFRKFRTLEFIVHHSSLSVVPHVQGEPTVESIPIRPKVGLVTFTDGRDSFFDGPRARNICADGTTSWLCI